jgi:hypothetical protein
VNKRIKELLVILLLLLFTGMTTWLLLRSGAGSSSFLLLGSLFFMSIIIGLVSVPSGIGGGILFASLAGAILPLHIDLVRGTSLLISLTASLASVPGLLRREVSSLPVALPVALITTAGSILGALAGLNLPGNLIRVVLGITVLLISLVMFLTGGREADTASAVPGSLSGSYYDQSVGRHITWQAGNSRLAYFLFGGVGFISGIFGLGAGWANLPILSLIMHLPLRLAAGTSMLVIASGTSAASMIYLSSGAVNPLLVIPSVTGMYIGSRLGGILLQRWHPRLLRWIIILCLVAAGMASVYRGLFL